MIQYANKINFLGGNIKSYLVIGQSIYVFESDFYLFKKANVSHNIWIKVGAYDNSELTGSHYHSGSLRWRKFTFTTLVTFQQLL